jgi:hypothetical protein
LNSEPSANWLSLRTPCELPAQPSPNCLQNRFSNSNYLGTARQLSASDSA